MFSIETHRLYCVCTAALHSFTQSLRQQTKGTNVKVVEIIPPAVATEIVECRGFNGMDAGVYADDTIAQLLQDKTEIGYQSDKIIRGSRDDLDANFNAWNGNTV